MFGRGGGGGGEGGENLIYKPVVLSRFISKVSQSSHWFHRSMSVKAQSQFLESNSPDQPEQICFTKPSLSKDMRNHEQQDINHS